MPKKAEGKFSTVNFAVQKGSLKVPARFFGVSMKCICIMRIRAFGNCICDRFYDLRSFNAISSISNKIVSTILKDCPGFRRTLGDFQKDLPFLGILDSRNLNQDACVSFRKKKTTETRTSLIYFISRCTFQRRDTARIDELGLCVWIGRDDRDIRLAPREQCWR